jgi:shikimate kinase
LVSRARGIEDLLSPGTKKENEVSYYMRIYLTGFMGSGKTTIGRLLSEKLSVPFIDLDHEIEHQLSRSIAQVFEHHGEYYFRDQETAILKSIQMNPLVVSTGGGCFIHNREWMLQNGIVIFLDLTFDEIVRRIGGDPERPLWKNAETLYNERLSGYRQAHFTIDASGSVEEVVEKIKALPLQEQKRTPEN